MIRSEQKMWIYQNYFIPSIRFLLTVHELTQTHVKVLDAFTHVYLKKWTGLPPSATNLVLHMKVGLDIPTIETLYNICHTLTHTAMRQKGDSTVNAVIDNSISRESQWTQKRSTVVACQEVYDHAISLHPLPLDDSVKERIKLAQGMKASVTKKVYSDCHKEQKKHLDTLLKQGDFLRFAEQEKYDPSWNSILYNLPKGTMKFILNSFTNTLPTQDNLKLWGKSFSDKCHLCKNRDSTLHCLNGCKVALNQGRYTWRHNNILQYIVNSVDTSRFSVYSDLPGYQTSNGGSLLPSLIVTTLKPDVVIVDNVKKEVVIYELTSPFEKNIHTQHKYKCDKYAHFETDIKSHKTTVVAFEVGARGGLTDQNITRLTNMHKQHLHRHIKKKVFFTKY